MSRWLALPLLAGLALSAARAHDAPAATENGQQAQLASLTATIDRQTQRGGAGRAGEAQLPGLRRLVAGGEHCERALLGVVKQAVSVHGDAVRGAEEFQLLRLRRRFRDLGQRDGLERGGERRHRALRILRSRLVAQQQLLAAAPAGDQADAHLDQAHIGLGKGDDCGAVQQDLAAAAHMSSSSLHQHFKKMTTLSPLQFQKQLRLHEARRLMLTHGIEAATAAHRVGYESPSQFSREYRRLFGAPPRREVDLLR